MIYWSNNKRFNTLLGFIIGPTPYMQVEGYMSWVIHELFKIQLIIFLLKKILIK